MIRFAASVLFFAVSGFGAGGIGARIVRFEVDEFLGTGTIGTKGVEGVDCRELVFRELLLYRFDSGEPDEATSLLGDLQGEVLSPRCMASRLALAVLKLGVTSFDCNCLCARLTGVPR